MEWTESLGEMEGSTSTKHEHKRHWKWRRKHSEGGGGVDRSMSNAVQEYMQGATGEVAAEMTPDENKEQVGFRTSEGTKSAYATPMTPLSPFARGSLTKMQQQSTNMKPRRLPKNTLYDNSKEFVCIRPLTLTLTLTLRQQ
jgi:hypothetical protein